MLEGRRILVTGAAGGIGAAVVDAVAAAGGDVVSADQAAAAATHVDVTDPASVDALFRNHGPFDDIVHTAGICRVSAIAETSMLDWNQVIAVNLTGSFLIARAAARTVCGPGSIVLLASVAGLVGDPLFGAYCASKFAVVGLTQVLARELAPRGIRVNSVCPGGVRTAMSDETIRADAVRLGRDPAELRSEYEADVPLGRWADPSEVADACVYLLSPRSSYVSAQTLVLNGAGSLSAHR